MLSEKGERIYLQEFAEEKNLRVIVGKDIKCSRVIGRATGTMRKLNYSIKYMDFEKNLPNICKVTFGEFCTSMVSLFAWKYR